MLENSLMPKNRKLVIALISIVLIVLGLLVYQKNRPTSQTATDSTEATATPDNQDSPAESNYQDFYTADVANVATAYDFATQIPASYQAEAVSEIEAINIFDPAAVGDDNLEKSQIFIRYFRAETFLTLSTVKVKLTEEITVADRPAKQYIIEKKADVADFAHQPSWRNREHVVTDIKITDTSPSTFLVVAARPTLDDKIYQQFLTNLNFSQLIEPVAQLKGRITKKKFGQLITPANSPVSPERFSGYHTGIDVEYADFTNDVPVRAIAEGTIVANQTADGYGGVLAIKHEINSQTYVAIYGHLDPSSTPKSTAVKRGQKIAILGKDKSTETDGERKHLHFALHKGDTLNLAGYVQSQSELANWLDPLTIFP